VPVRAALFDLGNTLVSYYTSSEFTPILRRSLSACQQMLGHSDPSHEAQHALLLKALDLNQERPDLAVWPLEERLQLLFSDYAPDAAMTKRLSSVFLEPIFATGKLMPDALAVLEALRARGVKTAIVSNVPWGSPAEHWRTELARHGLLEAVDAVVFCVDVGWRKPHSAPFRRALYLLNVSATDAVFVGDDLLWDVEGAKRAKLRPILIAPPHEAIEQAGVTVATSLTEVLSKIDAM
jgi:HAD superfamily hydrolase (TIGR01509 family)